MDRPPCTHPRDNLPGDRGCSDDNCPRHSAPTEPDTEATLDSAVVTYTCDAGGCNAHRMALVLTQDCGWLPMCREHALIELNPKPVVCCCGKQCSGCRHCTLPS